MQGSVTKKKKWELKGALSAQNKSRDQHAFHKEDLVEFAEQTTIKNLFYTQKQQKLEKRSKALQLDTCFWRKQYFASNLKTTKVTSFRT